MAKARGRSNSDASEKDLDAAILVFAHYLGIDIASPQQKHLISIAEEAFHNIPEGWELGIGENENEGVPYFYNIASGQSVWTHPDEKIYFEKVKRAKEQLKSASNSNNNGKAKGPSQFTGPKEFGKASDSNRSSAKKRVDENSDSGDDVVQDFSDVEDDSQSKHKNDKNDGNSFATVLSPAPKPEQKKSVGFGLSDDDFFDNPSSAPNDVAVLGSPTSTDGGRNDTSAVGGDSRNSSPDPRLKVPEKGRETDDHVVFQHGAGARRLNSDESHSQDERGKASVNRPQLSVAFGDLELEDEESQHNKERERERERELDGERDDRPRTGDSRLLSGRFPQRGGPLRGGPNSGRGRGRQGNRDRDMNRDMSRDNVAIERNRDGDRDREMDLDRERDRDRELDRDRDRGRGGDLDRRDGRGRLSRPNEREEDRERERNRERGRGADFEREARSVRDIPDPRDRDREADSIRQQMQQQIDLNQERHQREISLLKDEVTAWEVKLLTAQKRSAGEEEVLRDDRRRLEERLDAEKRDKNQIELKLSQAQADMHAKVREAQEAAEIKLREAVRRAKAETEEEMQDKLKVSERRYKDEVDELKSELNLNKRRHEESLRELDSMRRKVTLSKMDGRQEANIEVDAMKATVAELEEQIRTHTSENRKLRDEILNLNGRLSTALQSVIQANAEADAAKAIASSSATETQSNATALVQATHKIQILDSECAQLKAQNTLLTRELDVRNAEVNKLKGSLSYSGDRLTTTDAETRRIKAQAQGEIQRLSSRVVELEALTNVLKTQLDQAGTAEQHAVREVQRELDRAEMETERLRERMQDMESKEESLASRIKTQERDLMKAQEMIFKKDRQIREEAQKFEVISSTVNDMRREQGLEAEQLRALLNAEKLKLSEAVDHHRREVDDIKSEVAQKIPQLLSSAIEKVELQWSQKSAREANDLKVLYEAQLERLRQEQLDEAASLAERDARLRIVQAEDKVEAERLRYMNKTLKRQNEELMEQVDDLRRLQRRMNMNMDNGSNGPPGWEGSGHGNSNGNGNGNPHYQQPQQHQQSHVYTPQYSSTEPRIPPQSSAHHHNNGQSQSFGYIDFSQLVAANYPNNKENISNPQNNNMKSNMNSNGSVHPEMSMHMIPMSAPAAFMHLQDQLFVMKQQLSSSLKDRRPPPTPLLTHSSIAALDMDMTAPTSMHDMSIIQVSSAAEETANLTSDREFNLTRAENLLHNRLNDSRDVAATSFADNDASSNNISSVFYHNNKSNTYNNNINNSSNYSYSMPNSFVRSEKKPRVVKFSPDPQGSGSGKGAALGGNVSFMGHYSSISTPADISYSGNKDRVEVLSEGGHEFDAISDGGYYEGYWKAKYAPKSKS